MMAEVTRLERQSDGERAYRFVRRAIIEGRYGPGQRIVEQKVATELDISRTPVREAVRRLETEGLVATEPNRGAQVRSLSDDDIADLYEARSRLEGYMAELAARRADDDDIAGLAQSAERFATAAASSVDDQDRARVLMRVNDDFHRRLVIAGRAEQVRRLLASAIDFPLVFRAFDLFTPAEVERSVLFHRLIVDAVGGREPERAGRLMVEHVLHGRDVVLAHLEPAREERASG